WHYLNLALSVILMLFLLVSLIYINRLTRAINLNTREKLLVRAPFSLYFGWITVATIANITAFLVGNNWDGFGMAPKTWTIILLVIGIIIASAVVIQNKDYIYPFVILWAYGGILTIHLSTTGFGGHYYSIMIAIVVCMVVMLVVTVFRSLYRD
ncbi:MAG: tryptophan-rich sensory protein, partial [Peptostreptococcaceae bacterium]|nr:tryptophan-rich sensory protein [Peptostreptococcaceae bacterium]